MTEETRRLLTRATPLALVLAVALVYAPSLGASYVWDDDVNVVTNGALRDVAGLRKIWTDVTATQQYYPLTHTTFWLQYQISGLSYPAFHAVNVALHAATASLVYLVLRRLAVRGAALGAALFALHPLNVESVAWITERKNVLSGALALGATLAYLRFDEGRNGERGASAGRGGGPGLYALSLALFVLALAAKTAVALLPAALLVTLWLLRGRRARALLPLAPFFALGAAAGLFTAHLERAWVGARGAEFAWTPAFRALVAGRAFLFYLGKLVWPLDLAFFYPRWDIDPAAPLPWLFPLAAAAVLAAALVAHHRGALGPGPLAALLAYAALIFPALGFFDVYFMRYAFVQNHFQYLAGIPVLAALGAGLVGLAERGAGVGSRAALAVIPAVLGALSVREAATFRDYETHFRAALRANPAAWPAAYNLGLRYQKEGRREEALTMLRAAHRVRPRDPDVVGSLGSALAEVGKLGEALPVLREAVALRPENAEGRYNLGLALDMTGRGAEAAAEYREALRLLPAFTRAERQLAWLLATSPDPAVRDPAAAVAHAERACARSTHTLARCLDTLAAAQAAAGDFEKARSSAARAVELGRAAGDRAAAAYEERGKLYARGEAYVAGARP